MQRSAKIKIGDEVVAAQDADYLLAAKVIKNDYSSADTIVFSRFYCERFLNSVILYLLALSKSNRTTVDGDELAFKEHVNFKMQPIY
nr:hypothetical protein BCU25_17820 [Vibrio cyclitrophicus]